MVVSFLLLLAVAPLMLILEADIDNSSSDGLKAGAPGPEISHGPEVEAVVIVRKSSPQPSSTPPMPLDFLQSWAEENAIRSAQDLITDAAANPFYDAGYGTLYPVCTRGCFLVCLCFGHTLCVGQRASLRWKIMMKKNPDLMKDQPQKG